MSRYMTFVAPPLSFTIGLQVFEPALVQYFVSALERIHSGLGNAGGHSYSISMYDTCTHDDRHGSSFQVPDLRGNEPQQRHDFGHASI
eukprot:9056748-Karenia_brevis.AAC.1